MKSFLLSIFFLLCVIAVHAQSFGGALHLNGVDEHVENNAAFDVLTNESDFTLECRFRKCASFPAAFVLLDYKGSTAGAGVEIFYFDSEDFFQIIFAGESGFENTTYFNAPYSSESVNNGEWKHFALTYENSIETASLYIDGIFISSEDSCSFMPSSGSLVLGSGDINFNWPFPGEIDEFRTSDIIRYTENFTPSNEPFQSDDNTISLFHFDEPEGEVVFIDEVSELELIGTSTTHTFHLIEAENLSVCPGTEVQLIAHESLLSYQWFPDEDLNQDQIFNPIATTNSNVSYVLFATDGFCDYEDGITINVGDLDAGVTGTFNICEGDSTDLNVCCGTTYTWQPSVGIDDASSSNPVFSPEETTTYTVEVFESVNCFDIDTITITVNLLPSASILATADTICDDNTTPVLFTADTDFGTSFLWSPFEQAGCQNCPITEMWADETTIFVLQVTSDDGCSSYAEQILVVEDCTNDISLTELQSVEVFPNPFSDRLSVVGFDTNVMTSIYNMYGIKVGSWQGKNSIDLSGLVSGTYVLVINTGKERVYRLVQKI